MSAISLANKWTRWVGRRAFGARRICFCAIATRNFLPWVLVLFDSLRRLYPQGAFVLLYVTRPDEAARHPVIEGVNVIGVGDLVDAATEATLRRRYTIPELCFSLKPRLLLHALDHFCGRAFYLDTDLDVHARFDEALIELESASAVLTPHLDSPVPMDGKRPTSLTILRAGVFNMGFMGVADTPEARALLAWWSERVFRWGFVAPEFAYQGDQKWMDLAPSLFPSVRMLRDPGYNVGYWNLQGRSITRNERGLRVNDRPLCFFHFSGLDPDTPAILSRFQDRFDAASVPVAMEMARDFSRRIVEARPRADTLPWRDVPATAEVVDPAAGATFSNGALPEDAYRARIAARHMLGTLETGEEAVIEVTVTNESPQTWLTGRDAQGNGGIALTWHLRGGGGDVIFWDNPRTFLGKDLKPGESRSYVVGIRIPYASGQYFAEFDLVHEGVTWFVDKGNPTATIELMVGRF